MEDFSELHVGRSWEGTSLEDSCPCIKEPCGLVALAKADPDCIQHGKNHTAKTMRQGHFNHQCLGN